jgi:hypothetical protein
MVQMFGAYDFIAFHARAPVARAAIIRAKMTSINWQSIDTGLYSDALIHYDN